ncbi:MAG: glycosyltransferase 87 family protein [Candidatus Aureabacteria bacterium]|nr:glycosyltransferase 87 family protein [Candidatus Auribacterota bacterium]
MRTVSGTFLKTLAGVTVLVYCAGTLFFLAIHQDIFQWDFKVHYYAGRAHAAGLDPYETTIAAGVEGSPGPRGFKINYPPYSLYVLSAISLLDYTTAFHALFALKCVLLAGLIYLWREKFLRAKQDLLFYLFCLLAFNSSIYIDFKAGNISVIEQFTLWLGFYFFLKRRLFFFCLFILLSAFFKITPLFFLCILWFSDERKKHLYFWGSIALVTAVALISYLCDPVSVMHFLHNTVRVLNRRFVVHQPSMHDLLEDLLMAGGAEPAAAGFPIIHGVAFLAVIGAVLVVTWRASALLKSLSIIGKDKIMIFLACTAYALILPNFEDYAYVILIVPAYFILTESASKSAGAAALVLFTIISSVSATLPLVRPAIKIVLAYSPLILAYLIWGLYVREIAIMARSARGQQ